MGAGEGDGSGNVDGSGVGRSKMTAFWLVAHIDVM